METSVLDAMVLSDEHHYRKHDFVGSNNIPVIRIAKRCLSGIVLLLYQESVTEYLFRVGCFTLNDLIWLK